MDQETCWRCGALADPGCARRQRLVAPAALAAESGYEDVTRGACQDELTLEIPRCRTCRRRDFVAIAATLAAAAAGAALGLAAAGVEGIWAGGFVGAGLEHIALRLADVAHRRRRFDDYPPLVRARASGWREPSD